MVDRRVTSVVALEEHSLKHESRVTSLVALEEHSLKHETRVTSVVVCLEYWFPPAVEPEFGPVVQCM
jgi:hypothetical protein